MKIYFGGKEPTQEERAVARADIEAGFERYLALAHDAGEAHVQMILHLPIPTGKSISADGQ